MTQNINSSDYENYSEVCPPIKLPPRTDYVIVKLFRIPHYANEYLFANVVNVEQDGTKYQHTLIWNSPVEGTSKAQFLLLTGHILVLMEYL